MRREIWKYLKKEQKVLNNLIKSNINTLKNTFIMIRAVAKQLGK